MVWEHIRAVHLEPLGLTQEEILVHARDCARPLDFKTAYITCINLRDNTIYFSLDNAELLIAFAQEHGRIPWRDIVAWQILHEKGHAACRQLYEPPPAARLYILCNGEDYYINRYLIPARYWPVCLANARCAVAIRTIAPLPHELRDGYYYCTLATFLAYDAITMADIHFLKSEEARFTGIISRFFRKILGPEDISWVSNEIAQVFDRLSPPPGNSWDNWKIPPEEMEFG